MLRLSHAAHRVSNAAMQLFVIRHAAAEDLVGPGSDAERRLTEAGRRKLRRAVRGLRALGIQLDHVLTSPWARAAETARLLAPIARGAPIATTLLAQPPGPELLALIANGGEVAGVVGHAPWLSELAAWLAFGTPALAASLPIRKAGVVWLDGSPLPGGMRLRAALPPKLLRAIG
jgi:phosphohistidine phosphatase